MSSGGKRQWVEVEIELLARKKVKKVEEVDKDMGEMIEGSFRVMIVGIMERMEMRMRQQATEASHLARAVELTNILLQCLVAKFGSVGHGEVPVEGNWKTEDEAQRSEYETEALLEIVVEMGSGEEGGKK